MYCIYDRKGELIFQSTLPHGSDQNAAMYDLLGIISIHAPSRERLNNTKALRDNILNFNPRSLTGATFLFFHHDFFFSLFQSTLPHGSDFKAR